MEIKQVLLNWGHNTRKIIRLFKGDVLDLGGNRLTPIKILKVEWRTCLY